jgi:hypothetical protein
VPLIALAVGFRTSLLLSYSSSLRLKNKSPRPGVGNLFFNRKQSAMTYYLIFQEHTLRLVPVLPEQEEIFCQLNLQRILASGESPMEVLQAFDALPLVFCDGL